MKYRVLDSEEWYKLTDLIPAAALPTPVTATAAVAEDDEGEIVGILFLQLQLHMEPLYINDPTVDFRRLVAAIEEPMKKNKNLKYWAFIAENSRVERMADIVGFERMPWRVWSKEVK